ncbi:HAMP domain-containing sensor histidine kinase [Yinghuangia sp. ASG 101]|uniref:HAMP domain-containing sensor histidine kinase n=1 Tax=Yinghuangia sp. ASG 101 TaxID=2896848 RepID=UPI001E51CA4F|nr:HAMP domain-containing sensor histidine kinase [Yinghuangia sp. ASG 101]UGQ13316.1 HAMP domain-containing sensor histidine kinase [Yinghuangia sp. ASG 101]
MTLFWRIFLLNGAVLVVAAVLLFGPVTVSSPVRLSEAMVLIPGLVGMLVINAVILRMSLSPLERLARAMTTADLLHPGARVRVTGPGEIADLITTYNTMLERLETERAATSAYVLSGQESERRRIAQELHDEVGQTLTAVLLQLKHTANHAPDSLRDDLHMAQETTRDGLDEIRRIARRLRPGVLEELGLVSALRALAGEIGTPALAVQVRIGPQLPPLAPETEVVLYRVAQEGLTNAARHSGADRAVMHLNAAPHKDADGVELAIHDNGLGLQGAAEGAGIRGMRERALLIGAELTIGPGASGGTDVRLRVPAHTEGGA